MEFLATVLPKSLIQTIFFQISQHFGTRGCQEHHQINMEDLKIVSNPMTGEVEYVEWVKGSLKQDKVDSSNNSDVFHSKCLQLVD